MQCRIRLNNHGFIFLVTVFWLLCAGVTGQAASSSQTETGDNALKVGISTNSPPFAYLQGKDLVGLEPELANELGKFLNRPVQFVTVPWKDQIPALLEGRTDIIMSGMSVTAMRQARIAFSEPYLKTGQMAMVRREDKNRYSQGYATILQQAPAQVIGAVKGTTGEQFVLKNFGTAKKIRIFDTSVKGMEALTTALGVMRIDILIHDGPILISQLAERQNIGLALIPELLTEEYLAWGLRKNDLELLESANRFLTEIKKNGRLVPIVQRWIPLTK
jgi:polar amino acid transport system substrate-binding protein